MVTANIDTCIFWHVQNSMFDFSSNKLTGVNVGATTVTINIFDCVEKNGFGQLFELIYELQEHGNTKSLF